MQQTPPQPYKDDGGDDFVKGRQSFYKNVLVNLNPDAMAKIDKALGIPTTPSPSSTSLTDDDHTRLRYIFKNFRGGKTNPRGLRLSSHGLKIMKASFESFEVQLNVVTNPRMIVTPMVLTDLERSLALPYFLDSQKIVVFDAQQAVWIYLLGSTLKEFVNFILKPKSHC